MPKSSSLSSDDISGLLKSESDSGVWDCWGEMEGDGGGGVQRGVVTFESECGFLDCSGDGWGRGEEGGIWVEVGVCVFGIDWSEMMDGGEGNWCGFGDFCLGDGIGVSRREKFVGETVGLEGVGDGTESTFVHDVPGSGSVIMSRNIN